MLQTAVSRRIGIAAIAGMALAAGAYGQTAREPNPDAVTQLLAEVRELRLDLQQMTAANVRMQLLVARLSLQEQRITTLDRQSVDVQERLRVTSRERSGIAEELRNMAAAAQDPKFPLDEQRAIEQQLPSIKTRLAEHIQREQQLQNQLNEIANVIAAEQGRWVDFNARLDDLERSLSTAPTK